MNTTAPRHYSETPALAGIGLPHDRAARIAARGAFVTLKQSFLTALTDIDTDGAAAHWLLRQVRAAEEPGDLWLLRAPMFSLLAGASGDRRLRRRALRRSLELLFPDSEMGTDFGLF